MSHSPSVVSELTATSADSSAAGSRSAIAVTGAGRRRLPSSTGPAAFIVYVPAASTRIGSSSASSPVRSSHARPGRARAASRIGAPAGSTGAVSSAVAAPVTAATRAGARSNRGHTRATNAAGMTASRPVASTSMAPVRNHPATVPMFHSTNTAIPAAQKPRRAAAGSARRPRRRRSRR